MKRVILTGGPCSGKTTVGSVLREEFHGQVCFVPEAATLLLDGGFPRPGKELPWSEEWQEAFQRAVLPLQRSREDAHALTARHAGWRLLVCDRGVLDGAAYTPGGVAAFCERYGVNEAEALARYESVIHLESLATAAPERYGRDGNEQRFEPLERARVLELAAREAWARLPRRIIIDGRRGIEGKISEVLGILRYVLAAGP